MRDSRATPLPPLYIYMYNSIYLHGAVISFRRLRKAFYFLPPFLQHSHRYIIIIGLQITVRVLVSLWMLETILFYTWNGDLVVLKIDLCFLKKTRTIYNISRLKNAHTVLAYNSLRISKPRPLFVNIHL